MTGGPIEVRPAGLSESRLTSRGILVGVELGGARFSPARREPEDGTARMEGVLDVVG